MFFKGAFTIKNLPTPFSVWDEYPEISVKFYNGTGGPQRSKDTYLFEGSVTVNFSPSAVTNFGTIFSKQLYEEHSGAIIDPEDLEQPWDSTGSPLKLVTTLDLYFVPTVDIFNQSYVEIQVPRSIALPMNVETGVVNSEMRA